jgi:chemotaxis protein MotA
MFSIIGIVVVFGAVVAGYLMEHGNLKVLMQPAELIIILGAAIGTVLVANPLHILKKIGSGLAGAFGGSPFNQQRYTDDAIEKHGLRGRAVKVLQKPFTHDTLAQAVREILGPVEEASACEGSPLR